MIKKTSKILIVIIFVLACTIGSFNVLTKCTGGQPADQPNNYGDKECVCPGEK